MVCKAAKQRGLVSSYTHAFGVQHALEALVAAAGDYRDQLVLQLRHAGPDRSRRDRARRHDPGRARDRRRSDRRGQPARLVLEQLGHLVRRRRPLLHGLHHLGAVARESGRRDRADRSKRQPIGATAEPVRDIIARQGSRGQALTAPGSSPPAARAPMPAALPARYRCSPSPAGPSASPHGRHRFLQRGVEMDEAHLGHPPWVTQIDEIHDAAAAMIPHDQEGIMRRP